MTILSLILLVSTLPAIGQGPNCEHISPEMEINIEKLCLEGTKENFDKNLIPELNTVKGYGPYLKSMAPSVEERYYGILLQKIHAEQVVGEKLKIEMPWPIKTSSFKKETLR